jgi:hypothetical protein
MERILAAGVLTLVFASHMFAQKKSTPFGDTWTGEVVTVNSVTREVTIKSTGKGETETFVGTLEEGNKAKGDGGSLKELKVSEILPGTRIRVFYKTKQQDVGGRKMKVHSIYRVNFLGRDEYTRLREALSLEPSAPVSLAESETLPAATPLKVYLAIELPHIKDRFVDWVGKWNREQAMKYGPLELVADLAHSDIAVVAHRGSENVIPQLPIEFYDAAGNVHRGLFSRATAYILTKGDGRLEMLWRQELVIASGENREISKALIEKELEKRMKARARAQKK